MEKILRRSWVFTAKSLVMVGVGRRISGVGVGVGVIAVTYAFWGPSSPAYPPLKITRKEVYSVAVFKDHKKDPDARLDWIFDWGDWLAETETISDFEFIVDPGITVDDELSSNKTTTVWLMGGTEGQTYKITNRITTSEGRIDDRSFTLRITQR